MRTASALFAAAVATLGGCAATGRSASLELETRQGLWRLDGVRTATLKRDGWEVRVVRSRVGEPGGVPHLNALVLRIVNTSPSEPLIVEPEEITLSTLTGPPILLGPDRRVLLNRGDGVSLTYAPGLRSPTLPYPFVVRITVFRELGFGRSQAAKLTLY